MAKMGYFRALTVLVAMIAAAVVIVTMMYGTALA
jgi:hypothetical protein